MRWPRWIYREKATGAGRRVYRVLGLPVWRTWDREAVKTIEESPFFDARWYRAHAARPLGRMSAALHFLRFGAVDGVEPSAAFCSRWVGVYCGRVKHKCMLLAYERNRDMFRGVDVSVPEFERQHLSERDVALARALNKGILLVSHELSRTGAPVALIEMATRLRALGYAPVVASPSHGALEDECKARGIPSRVSYQFKVDESCMTELERVRLSDYVKCFDLVVLSTIVAVEWIDRFSRTGVKVICWAHEGTYGFDCHPAGRKVGDYLRKCARVYTGGEYPRAVMLDRCGRDLWVRSLVYGVADLHQSDGASCSRPAKVDFVLAGTIDMRKGQAIALKAVELLPAETQAGMTLTIIGRIADRTVGQMVLKCSLPCVVHVEEMPLDRLLERIRRCEVLLCPSLDDPMPVVATYALMFGKPVIASDHTGTAALLQDGVSGFVVKAGDSYSLAAAMRRCVERRDRLPEMGQAARRVYQENFTVEAFDRNLKKVLADVGL